MIRFRLIPVLWASLAAALFGSIVRAEDKPARNKPESVIPQEKDRGRHEQFLKDKEEQSKKGPIQVVFIGDSITDGWRGSGHATWQTSFGDKYNALNLGIGGDRTEHVLWRIAHGELDGITPKAIVMMIGTNNSGSSVHDMIAGVTADVAAVHDKLPHAKILLLGIFPRGANPADGARAKIKQVNEALSKLDGKDNVKYLDIGAKFLEADGALPGSIMPDALHPNEKGYAIWAEAIRPMLEELTK
jgi:lysophospholipase L1-like esterase